MIIWLDGQIVRTLTDVGDILIQQLVDMIITTFYILLVGALISLPFYLMYKATDKLKKEDTPPDEKDIDTQEDEKLSLNNCNESDEYPYQKVFLLTKNEWSFYRSLKPITDKYKLHILSKVRMADIVQVKKGLSNKKFYSAFGKIKSRHIDFVLADPRNLRILMAIELDDSSHENIDRQQSDFFEDKLFETVGLPFLRVKSITGIEEQICEKLKISMK